MTEACRVHGKLKIGGKEYEVSALAEKNPDPMDVARDLVRVFMWEHWLDELPTWTEGPFIEYLQPSLFGDEVV